MTGLISSETKTTFPVRPRDRQRQVSSLMDMRETMQRLAVVEHRKEFPDDALNGYTYEIVVDGAGNHHYNLTVHFYDQREPPALDPSNLNGAEQAVFGQYLTPEELAEKGIGVHDARFKT